MRGHEALVAMRRAGVTPLSVDIRDEAPGWVATEWHHRFPRCAFLAIRPDEPLHSLDLRCVVGLPVQISSASEKRLGELLRRVRTEAPSRLIGTLFADNPRADLLAVYDSEGVLTWRNC